jgi:uncharacterized Fe-S cluster-containing radical SAM superfamily protein
MYTSAVPIVANVVVTRRCNLSCSYCNQYDDVSPPVPTSSLKRRIELLGQLGTQGITFTGGEPLLHPDIVALVREARRHGTICTLNTNGLLLTPALIQQLNKAGLDYLWMSIDNTTPDEASHKSLKVLDLKLQWLAQYATFHVTVNSVLGAGVRNPEDALKISQRARELGHKSTVGIIHGEGGQLIQIGARQQDVYARIKSERQEGIFWFAHYDSFQENLIRGQHNDWHCTAGGRFLYICEDGLVSYCSQRRGEPGIPLEQYTPQMVVAEAASKKSCAPLCTINCVQQVSYVDSIRANPKGAIQQIIEQRRKFDPNFRPPLGLRILNSMFVEGKGTFLWTRAAILALGLRNRKLPPAPLQS